MRGSLALVADGRGEGAHQGNHPTHRCHEYSAQGRSHPNGHDRSIQPFHAGADHHVDG